MKICVIGLGYIGLPTSLLLAAAGYSVVGFDVDKKKFSWCSLGSYVHLYQNDLLQ